MVTTTMTNDKGKDYGFRFRDWDIYKDAREFRVFVNKLLKKFPKDELYVLVNQTKRALNSIILNIAEGANRGTDKDTKVFINRAHTSLDEVVACMDCGLDDGYITPEEHAEVLSMAESLAKRLRKFTAHLSSSSLS